jgi:ataxin-3
MAAPTSSDATSIFHEKQIAALCGRHAINNLLQGAYIDEFSLAAIAAELDAKERELMLAEGADTPDAIRFLAEDSHNVDDAGNFSVSVLSEYLQRAHGVTLESDPAAMSAALADPNSYSAYFLNFEHHWFALRRLRTKTGPRWFNLNSTLKVPEVISDFFLSAYLAQLRSQGYTIFPVGGRALPEPFANGLGAPGTLHTVGQILAAGTASAGSASSAAEARRQAAQRAREEAAADPDMAAALQASLAQSDFASYAEYEAATGGGGNAKRPRPAGPGDDEEAQLRRAIAESLGTGGDGGAGAGSGSGSSSGGGAAGTWGHDDDNAAIIVDDDAGELAAAIAMSMAATAGAGAGPGTAMSASASSASASSAAPSAAATCPARRYAAASLPALVASLAAEPGAAPGAAGAEAVPAGSVIRVQLRLPPAEADSKIAPAAGGGSADALSAPTHSGALQLQRRFRGDDPATALFDWAAASWLARAAGPTSKAAFALPSFCLAMAGLPPRTLSVPEVGAEPQTIAALLGPATSASLTLRPAG